MKGLRSKISNISSERLSTILDKIDKAGGNIENSKMMEEKKEKLLDVLAELEELIITELDERGESADDVDETELLDEIFSEEDTE